MIPLLVRTQAFVNGTWCHAPNGRTFAVHSPATGEQVGEAPDFTGDEAAEAIEAAHAAWPAWRALTAKERAAILRRWFELIMAHRDELARIMSQESGKVIAESLGEVTYGASFVEWFAEEGKRAYGDVIPPHTRDRRLVVIKQGVGVVAAITPWNFPLAMITRKVAPALAAGCPVVIKPATETPLTALALASLAEAAGFPAGVYNTITTTRNADVGEALCAHPLVRKLSFTGSTTVGRRLMAQCAPTLKKLSLELGGNAPFIVFDDADVDAAVRGAVQAKYRHNGQTCVCVNRILVQRGIHDRFVARFVEAVAALRTGDSLDPDAQVGPLVNERALHKVQAFVNDAVAQGAQVQLGGTHSRGLFYDPTVLTGATASMRIAREEVFGPVAPVFTFDTEDEAVSMANDTEFGLAAYFYTRDVGRCWRVAEALEYGMVGINEGLISTELAPFGGIKQSGMEREGSRYGLDAYLETRYLCFGGL
jgi:succinate-semialdehyde dehydrogenase/glutarate-semialdehyde dehydrogenase